jgi:hypothetical protein
VNEPNRTLRDEVQSRSTGKTQMRSPSAPGADSPMHRRVAQLEARRNVLLSLAQAGSALRARLQDDPAADVAALLDARERECARLASLASPTLDKCEQSDLAQLPEAGPLAQTMVSLQAESEAISEEIIECQRECESLLKERLKAAAHALRESIQRRRLDAAYGPACRHSTPSFLDRQQ